MHGDPNASVVEVQMADARLIAAAPELLAFARNYVASLDACLKGDADPSLCDCIACALTSEARAAIAKAEGKS